VVGYLVLVFSNSEKNKNENFFLTEKFMVITFGVLDYKMEI